MPITNHMQERFMAPFAIQAKDNVVVGMDSVGFVQRALLFDHYVIPTIWLRDIQLLLRKVDPHALCEMLDAGCFSFHLDSSTAAEMGQARADLNFAGNVRRLPDDEFSFSTIRGRDDLVERQNGLSRLAYTEGVDPKAALAVAERVEARFLSANGLELHASAFKEFYADLRNPDSPVLKQIVSHRLSKLGIKPRRLELSVTEPEAEDFRVVSNLRSTFGLTSSRARSLILPSLFDLLSVHIRTAQMREFNCLLGMNEEEKFSWCLRADRLAQTLHVSSDREHSFVRVLDVVGVGAEKLTQDGKINLRKIIELRSSDELTIFKKWLADSDEKSDAEIRDRFSQIRGKIGNALQGDRGKLLRLLISTLPSLITNYAASTLSSIALTATDSFLLERAFPKDVVLALVGKEYPSIFKR